MGKTTTTYIPRISYNGKELSFKISLFLILLISVFTSCKSQPTTTTSKNAPIKQAVANSVAYEIVKDTILCNGTPNGKYVFEFLKVSHSNKAVQDSINNFFFKEQYENFNEISEGNISFDKLRNTIQEICADKDSWGFFDTGEFNVVFNDRNIFSVNFTTYDINGRGFPMYYAFSLKTGKLLENPDIFNDRSDSLINDLKKKAFERLKVEYKDVLENERDKGEAMRLKELIDKDNIGGYSFSFDENIKGLVFMIFLEEYYHTPYLYTFNLSFKELESYLTDSFKTLISIN